MSGETPTPEAPKISEEQRKRFERIDFDEAFSQVQAGLNEYLQRSIGDSFGINKVIISADSLGGPLDPERDYSETLRVIECTESPEGSQVLIFANPGEIAVDRFWGALDEYSIGREDELRFVSKTRAHEMYSTALVANSFLLAAMEEFSGGEYPDFRPHIEHIDKTLRNSFSARKAIDESEFDRKDEIQRLMDFIVTDAYKAAELNEHRLAAALYFEVYRRNEKPLKDAIVFAMREAVEHVLFKLELDDETAWEKLDFHSPTPEDVELAEITGQEANEIMKLDKANRVRAERLSLDVLGWAFPMSVEEITGFLNGFTEKRPRKSD